ncbi:hypothetical protein [Rhodococcus opacus]|uniref:hypothetical protein n=1 Tax=Rhodococcus opacus TaxID=37919 RepID=UPI0012FDD3A1|nr:hypothetical protein [Rhodococcus opacus]
MPKTEVAFEESTAFERYILSRAAPFFPPSAGGLRIELDNEGTGSATVFVRVNDSSTCPPGQHLTPRDIYPLVFGAAWKILDLLIELRLYQDGMPTDRDDEYTFTRKVGCARSGNVKAKPPFNKPVWAAIAKTYAATAEYRHLLVHGHLPIDPVTGDMTAADSTGRLLQPLTVDEQSAFCRVAEGTAQAVISGQLTRRQANQLKWLLDQLANHHQQPLFNVAAIDGSIPVIVMSGIPDADNEIELDFAALRRRVSAQVADQMHYDLEVHLPDKRILAATLEEAPNRALRFPLDEPLPEWLRWK